MDNHTHDFKICERNEYRDVEECRICGVVVIDFRIAFSKARYERIIIEARA